MIERRNLVITDREKLVRLATHIRALNDLRRQQSAMTAKMIRACVDYMQIDPNTYRLRGYETWMQRAAIINENKQWKAQAPLYLLALATQLENEAVRSPDDLPKENSDVHGSESTPPAGEG